MILSSDLAFNLQVFIGLVFSLPMEWVIGLVLAAVFYRLPSVPGAFILLIVTALKISSFLYESEFGRLPGAEVFFYVGELDQLRASISSGDLLALLLMMIISTALLGYLFRRCADIKAGKATVIPALLVIAGVVIQLQPSLVPTAQLNASRESLTWPFLSNLLHDRGTTSTTSFSLSTATDFMALHGFDGKIADPAYPVCQVPTDTTIKNPRNVVIVLMEGVGKVDMFATINGKPVMPNLQRIAAENFSHPNFVSSGSKSIHAMVAMFSGIPGNPLRHQLWNDPTLNMQSYVPDLRRQGYQTSYIQGADLSFENQRKYLTAIQFEHILEFEPAAGHRAYGWGYDDGVTFNQLKQELIKADKAEKPAFITLATLSTHHPYQLPADWQAVFVTDQKATELDDISLRRAEAQHFTDYYLGQFYDWFKANYPDDILLITSDHMPHQREVTTPDDLQLPMVVVSNFTDETRSQLKARSQAIATHYDIPATLAGLLGSAPQSCNLGIDFLSNHQGADRYVYSPVGNGLERLFVWHGDEAMIMNWVTGEMTLFANDEEITVPQEGVPASLRAMFGTIITTHNYLRMQNRYGPPGLRAQKPAIDTVNRPGPIFVSHRGNLNGPDPANENRPAALEAVAASDLEWVEIDIQITQDSKLVLGHDDEIKVAGQMLRISERDFAELRQLDAGILSLEEAIQQYGDKVKFLLEAKTPRSVDRELFFPLELSRIVKKYQLQDRVIIDGFDRLIVDSAKRHCDCQVGFDAPFQKPLSAIEFVGYAESNLDWVYVHEKVFNSQLLDDAHKAGIKVMVYTVNDPQRLKDWAGYLPDGIITDYQQVAKAAR